jgi:hypothetical protein
VTPALIRYRSGVPSALIINHWLAGAGVLVIFLLLLLALLAFGAGREHS